MNKSYKIMLFLLGLLLVLLTYLEANAPRSINWTPSYTAMDKIPLGSSVLFENLKDQPIRLKQVRIPPYEFLSDSSRNGTYFFLNDKLSLDPVELEHLLEWIRQGNTGFLIAGDFNKGILDSLGLEISLSVPLEDQLTKPLLNLTDSALKKERPFLLDHEIHLTVFSQYDSLNQDVLGVSQLLREENAGEITDPQVNFLRDSIGKGVIYLHSTPEAFSNYFLLEGQNSEYAERVLAYLPTETQLFWDSYYKSGKTFNTSPLFVILNSRPLKWSYYFVIGGVVLFILFEGKRKQRSIPVVNQLSNRSLDFVRTISGLYLDRKDYKSICLNKIALFLEYLRNHYRISNVPANRKFFQRLSAVSGCSLDQIEYLWDLMETLKKKKEITRKDLIHLNQVINNFKNKKNGK